MFCKAQEDNRMMHCHPEAKPHDVIASRNGILESASDSIWQYKYYHFTWLLTDYRAPSRNSEVNWSVSPCVVGSQGVNLRTG